MSDEAASAADMVRQGPTATVGFGWGGYLYSIGVDPLRRKMSQMSCACCPAVLRTLTVPHNSTSNAYEKTRAERATEKRRSGGTVPQL